MNRPQKQEVVFHIVFRCTIPTQDVDDSYQLGSALRPSLYTKTATTIQKEKLEHSNIVASSEP